MTKPLFQVKKLSELTPEEIQARAMFAAATLTKEQRAALLADIERFKKMTPEQQKAEISTPKGKTLLLRLWDRFRG